MENNKILWIIGIIIAVFFLAKAGYINIPFLGSLIGLENIPHLEHDLSDSNWVDNVENANKFYAIKVYGQGCVAEYCEDKTEVKVSVDGTSVGSVGLRTCESLNTEQISSLREDKINEYMLNNDVDKDTAINDLLESGDMPGVGDILPTQLNLDSFGGIYGADASLFNKDLKKISIGVGGGCSTISNTRRYIFERVECMSNFNCLDVIRLSMGSCDLTIHKCTNFPGYYVPNQTINQTIVNQTNQTINQTCSIDAECLQNVCFGMSCVNGKCKENEGMPAPPSCEERDWKGYPDCKWVCKEPESKVNWLIVISIILVLLAVYIIWEKGEGGFFKNV